ncbi:MAG TPA: type II toxin-antitoxin system RelE/ParE family toxin [Paraburkholderia sp.]
MKTFCPTSPTATCRPPRANEAIEQATSQLPQHPYLYRLGRADGTREIVVHPNYLVIYRVTSIAIEIVAVVHARQQYPK